MTETFPAGSRFTLAPTITLDDAAYNLTGKTVTVTVRKSHMPQIVLHSSLEDVAVTVVTPLTGAVTVDISSAACEYLAPYGNNEQVLCLAQFRVVEDDYLSATLPFYVTPSLD
jgi:hypothetical protein